MKKTRTIPIVVFGILAVLIALGIILWVNRGKGEALVHLEEATIPTVSFESLGKKVNLLVGHRTEMDMIAMRDTIAVCEKNRLTAYIEQNAESVKNLKYEVYSLDGSEKLQEGSVDKVEDKVTLEIGKELLKDQEGVLKITLQTGERSYYYYTRVISDNEYHAKECLAYVMELHENMLKKENEDEVKKVMEANSKGNNKTLQKVTIHSNIQHSMWGSLTPKVVSGPYIDVKEVKAAYTAVQLSYHVECAGDNNEKELYQVKEFFKVANGTKRVYLMDYERTMEEVFDTENVVLGSKGIILGIAKENLPYKVNEDGTIVAFVQANALWSYHKEEDTFHQIFSFTDPANLDVRNHTDEHSVQILAMEDSGNLTFSVCGYMNRGNHEGESGVAIYYYDASSNIIEEVAFIPSASSRLMIQNELHDLAYFNKEQGLLYVMTDGTLLKVQTKNGKSESLIEGLQKGQYVSSGDGCLLAYQKTDNTKTATEIRDFSKDSTWEIKAEEGEDIVPLGFIGEDFVYGITKAENAGVDAAGLPIRAMHRLEIRNSKNEIVKTYEKQDVYILGVTIGNNMITLRQGTKDGNHYVETSEDYITNSEASGNENVELKSYWTDLKETQYRIVFSKGIKDKKAKTVNAKFKVTEKPTVLSFEKKEADYYYVYGHGEQAGIFTEAGEAVALAESLSGVVISPKQNYIWEADNRVAWYRNFEVDRFTPKEGESTLAACLRKVLAYEKKKADAVSELGSKPAQEILQEQLGKESVSFKGCSVKSMFYLIDKGVPIIALKDGSSAILLIGYDAQTVTYVEPTSGSIFSSNIDKVNEMLSGSGRTFIGYVR